MTSTVLLDAGWATTADAEHGALRLLGDRVDDVVTACTRSLPADATGPPRVIVVAELTAGAPGPFAPPTAPVAGRAFRFTGWEALTGTLTVAELLRRSAIDVVTVLGTGPAAGDEILDTQGFVRPLLADGRLVLLARPAAGGRLVPFEQPHPTPCCADHS